MSVPPQSMPSHLAIYRRWRAQTFAAIVGQEAIVETLRNAVRLGRVGHAYLFVGPRGTGKTSLARILAKAVNCTDLRDGDPCDVCPSCVAIREGAALDVAEFDAASRNRVDDMRELVPRIFTVPADLRRKVFIVDEVQRIKEGWDVLLKVLEEPPPHVLFVFCTTDQSQIRPAVISRVQRFVFRPLTNAQIIGKLERILAELGVSVEPDAVELIAALAAGGMRDAESMLDQLLSLERDPLTAADVRAQLGLAEASSVEAYLRAFVSGDALEGIAVLDAVEHDGRDLRLFVDQAVERLRHALRAGLATPGPTDARADPLARAADPALLAGLARRLAELDMTRPSVGGLRLPLELYLLERGREPAAPGGVDLSAPRAGTRARGGTPPPPEHPAWGTETGVPASDAGIAVPASDVTTTAPGPAAASAAPGRDEAVATLTGAGATPTLGRAGAAPTPTPDMRTPPADAPTPTAEAEAAGAPPDAGVLERLRVAWPDVVAHVSRNPANRPLIAACRPVRVEGEVVVLGFPEDQAFLRDIAERKRAALEEGVAAVLGAHYGVRCVSTNLEAPPTLQDDATAREVLAQARRVFAQDLAEASEVE